jgi:hypothetical protein
MGSITSNQLIDLFAERTQSSPVNASSAWLCEVRRQYSIQDLDPIEVHGCVMHLLGLDPAH